MALDVYALQSVVLMVSVAVNYYRKTSNASHTLVGNKIVDNSRCSWSIACRRCSNYIFILNLTPGFNGLSEDNCKRIQETFKLGIWCDLY